MVAAVLIGTTTEIIKLGSLLNSKYSIAFQWFGWLMTAFTIYYLGHHLYPDVLTNHALSEIPVYAFVIYAVALLLFWASQWLARIFPLIVLIYPYLGWLALIEVASFGGVYSWPYLLILALSIWSADAAAYLVGSTFKGPKLAPKISPNKTISGWLGALVGVALISIILNWQLLHWDVITLLLWIIFIWLSATTGDLFESLIKRGAGVKDSGVFLPGHGGFLDRLDSMLFAAPFAYFVLQFIQK